MAQKEKEEEAEILRHLWLFIQFKASLYYVSETLRQNEMKKQQQQQKSAVTAHTSSLSTGEADAFLSLTPAWSTSQCQAGQGYVIKLWFKRRKGGG